MGAKKTDEFYSLLNITNGNILSAPLNPAQYRWGGDDSKLITRQRNWKLSQFQTEHSSVLDSFINNASIDTPFYWRSMGVHEVWVKEEDIDSLYAVLALVTLNNFCGYYSSEKQKALFGAFLFHKDPKLFIDIDFTATRNSASSELKKMKAGKEFLEFLESFGVLSFAKGRQYVGGQWVESTEDRCFFSISELDLVKRQRKDIITTFEQPTKEQ